MRDRAADVLAEEADLARTLAGTWGAGRAEAFPRLHLAFDRLLERTPRAGAGRWSNVPESPDTPTVAASAWAGGLGAAATADGAVVGERLRRLLQRRLPRRRGRRRRRLRRPAGVVPARRRRRPRARRGGTSRPDEAGRAHRRGAAAQRASCCPALKLAVLTEADLTGRRRAHRQPRPRRRDSGRLLRRPQARRLRRPPPARRRPLRRHGARGRSAASSATTCCSSTRAATSSTCPSDQIDAVRHYTGGETPTLHRLGGSDFARTKARVRQAVRRDRPGAGRAVPEAAEHARATPSRPTRRGSTSWRSRSRTRRRPTS